MRLRVINRSVAIVHLCRWKEKPARQTAKLVYLSGSSTDSSIPLLFIYLFIVICRYGHGFEMFCLASDSARTVVASACKVSVIRQQRPALPDPTLAEKQPRSALTSPVLLPDSTHVDFDGIVMHELTQFLIICLHFRHGELDYSPFF